MFKTIFEGRKMFQPSQTIGGVAATSSPGIIYTLYAYLSSQPIEKYVSAATFAFVCLQIFFLLKDRLKKRRERKAAK